MGLITGLLTLPLAPLRGTIAVAELLLEEAEAHLNDPDRIREELRHVEHLRAEGVLTDEEAMSWEDSLIDRLANGDRSAREGSHR